MTFGGPIVKNKLLFFTSYQGTRQTNGVAPGCSATFTTPPLTDDRSAAALGALFYGQPTFIQEITGAPLGPSVAQDGSNISPQALALLQRQLPNGQYLYPTPQRIDTSLPFASQGSYSISNPCPFYEEQFMTNADWNQSDKEPVASAFLLREQQPESHATRTKWRSYRSGVSFSKQSTLPEHFAHQQSYVLE